MFITYFFIFMFIWFLHSWNSFKISCREEGRSVPFKEWSLKNKLFIFRDGIWFLAIFETLIAFTAVSVIAAMFVSTHYEESGNYFDNYIIKDAYEITSFDNLNSIYTIKERDRSSVQYVYLRANGDGTANIEESNERNSIIVYTNSTTVPHIECHKYKYNDWRDYIFMCFIDDNYYIYVPEGTILDRSTLTERG